MLLLARKVNEEIILTVPPSTETRTIRLVVIELRIKQEIVRLGFEADESIVIHRKEVQDLIDKENH